MHCEIALAAAKAGKMILCEKPLAMDVDAGPARWSTPSRRPGSPTWSGTTIAASRPSRWPSSSSTRASWGGSSTIRAKFLQDWTISTDLPQGGHGLWRLDVNAAGSGVTGDLLAHCIDTARLAQRRDRPGQRHDRDLHQGAQAQPDRQGRNRSASTTPARSWPVRQRLAGHLRVHPVRPGPQGAVHLRDQRRGCVASRGISTTCIGSSTSTTATRASCAAGARSTSRTATIRTCSTGGSPACRSATSTASCTSVADFLEGLETGKTVQPDFQDALSTQRVCQAVLESAKLGKWVKV